jgi:acetyl-CoA C-acetyltransferase
MESMSNAPYLLEKARNGYRMGHGQIKDHMFLDGLEDAYDRGKLMGTFAEATAEKYGFTRAQQDAFAIQSLTRAKKAIELGLFQEEIVPVPVLQGKTEVMITQDEQPGNAKIDKIPQLKPAFKDPGTVTAANSSSISDGAAALMLMRLSEAQRRGLTPLAKIVGHTSDAHEPQWFTTAPVTAMERLMQEIHWTRDQVDLFEINEAFAVVTLAAIHDLKLDPEKVNIHGGACALGHPLGASGTRIVCTLLSALKHHNLNRGIASLCVGGGEATAIAIDRLI